MNKAKFFRYCDNHQGKPDELSIDWGCIHRELERAVFLHGRWAFDSVLSVQVYQPTPGRQHEDCYIAANEACEKAAAKFQRWLDEWKAKR